MLGKNENGKADIYEMQALHGFKYME